MFPFWSTFLEPILKALKPSVIVEIGAEGGWNTEKILEFCRDSGARCHVIDPLPIGRSDEIGELLRRHGVHHQGLSLDVLPRLVEGDVYLIDGDHNWYTVYHEVSCIVQTARRQGRRPPVMLFHDISWPYGRRDMYYDPATIPPESRKPHARKGMRQGKPELVEKGGLNEHLQNALVEGGARNGVLTAIEDFMRENAGAYSFMAAPGFHGLGILCPVEGLDPAARRELDAIFAIPDRIRALMVDLERDRIAAITRFLDCDHARKELERRLGASQGACD